MMTTDWVNRFFLIACIGSVTTGCSQDWSVEELAPASKEDVELADHEAGTPPMPPDLRAAYIAKVQADAPAHYHVTRSAAGSWLWASNRTHRLDSEFTAAGVAVTHEAREGSQRLTLELARYGCEHDLVPVGRAAPESAGNRVEYRRLDAATGMGITEWYVNGPLGLEQGFTLSSAPPCRGQGGGWLEIEIGIGGGLVPLASDGGKALELVDGSGAVVMRYTDLFVRDAVGRRLPADLRIGDGSISILVDDTGAEYPLDVDPLIGTLQEKFFAADADVDDWFGSSMAMWGNTAVIGAPGEGAGTRGAAYVFVRSGATWFQQAKLVASDGTDGDRFGGSVAIAGDTIVVGTTRAWQGSTQLGAAYVFVRSGSQWSKLQTLVSSDGVAGDGFGSAVAINGHSIMVGAPFDASNPASYHQHGAAYIFGYNGSTWSQQAKLVPSDAASPGVFAQGSAVTLSGDTETGGQRAVMGSQWCDDGPGGGSSCRVYVFNRAGTWTPEAILFPSGPRPHFRFGATLGISENTLVVGTQIYNDFGPDVEAAAVFTRDGELWSPQATLMTGDFLAPPAHYGWGNVPTVAFSGADIVAISGYWYSSTGPRIFKRTGTSWSLESRIEPPDGGLHDLGRALALSGNTLLVGRPFDDDRATDAGAAYAFVLQAQPIISMAPAVNVTVGPGSPQAVISGDFNGDGLIDLATANYSSANVSVLLGAGNGGFGSETRMPVGQRPRDIVTVDLDSNGTADLVTANYGSDSVSVLLGSGSGGFGAPASFAVGSSPAALATADIDGDGLLDLAVANRDGNTVSILRGTGTGSFHPAVDFPVDKSPRSIAAADLDGDGKIDLITANTLSATLTILYGDGSGSFAAPVRIRVGINPRGLAVADFNGDGTLDIAVGIDKSNVVKVLLRRGMRTYTTPEAYSTGLLPYDVIALDVDGDAILDLAVPNSDAGTVSILRGDGAGRFLAAVDFPVGIAPHTIIAADFDGDAKLDLAAANSLSRSVSVLRNTSPSP